MWGNRLGWALAAAMVLVMAISLFTAYVVSSKRTQPTAFVTDPANLATIRLPVDPKTLLPGQARDGDAREQYWRTIADYQSKQRDYEQLAAAFDLQTALALDGVGAVLAAADYQKATLFDGRAEAAIGYGTPPALDGLRRAGAICARIGAEYASRKEYTQAKRYLDAALVLGYRMYSERLSRMELSAGLGLMAQAAAIHRQIAKETGDADAVARYGDFITQYQHYCKERIEPMERVITSVDPNVQAEHVGDVFVIVDESKERAWRVEGVLKLGMYKYNTNTAGDRRAAIRRVKSLLQDPDPAIAAAALAAKQLTLEQYRMLGSR